jgi:CRP-like cAMP-binding protein
LATQIKSGSARQYPCERCPLRPLDVFRDFEKSELAFVSGFKKGELRVDKGATVLVEGSHSAHLYTVLFGLGFRYKLMADGRRQILNYLLPGDLIGLQGSLMGEMQHSVEALSPMLLCVFEREQLHTLYQNHPGLAYDITWIASREEQMLDENLLSIGRRTALERSAYLLSFIWARAGKVNLIGKGNALLPITQQHVADTLGLSLVHTNRTLRKLVNRKLIAWRDGGCEVLDFEALTKAARWEGLRESLRPLV